MGKQVKPYRYDAYEKAGGRWIGFVVEDPRLEVPGQTKEKAIAEVKKTHNELIQDARKFGEDYA